MLTILAPMEGVIDPFVRHILTRIGGYDLCITEFIRITNSLLPARIFYGYCPELYHQGKTASGVPVHVQILGSSLQYMAENAFRASELGALGIDINFGCPSPKVNRHQGGCILLEKPETVFEIVRAVRQAVPASVPVSAKMRLGVNDKSLALENARAMTEGGAGRLTVHARTKLEGYKPPAHWEWIAKIREVVSIPVTANGEIWCLDDYLKCRKITGCEQVMVGRGAIASPDLGKTIARWNQTDPYSPQPWPMICQYVCELYENSIQTENPRYVMCRMKQWLSLMRKFHPQAVPFFEQIKTINQCELLYQVLQDTICVPTH